jgi:hypothetical protein
MPKSPEKSRKYAARCGSLRFVKDILRGSEHRSSGHTARYNRNRRYRLSLAESRYFRNVRSVLREPNHG